MVRLKDIVKDTLLVGKLIAVTCAKSCFVYDAEEGKRVGSLEAFEKSCTRWAQLDSAGGANLLAIVDCHSFAIRWSVNGDFALPDGCLALPKASFPLLSFEADNTRLTTLQEDGTLSVFAAPFAAAEIGSLAALSRTIQAFSRSFEDLLDGFGKLNKFSLSLFESLSEHSQLLRDLMLFGETKEAHVDVMSESDFLEHKQRLKKLHAELLVQIQDAYSACDRFTDTFEGFAGQEVPQLRSEFLHPLEQENRKVYHEFLDFLAWLEPLVIKKTVSGPLQPPELAFKLLKAINQLVLPVDLEVLKGEYGMKKLALNDRFSGLLSSFSDASLSLQRPLSQFSHPAGSKLLSAEGIVLLPGDKTLVSSLLPIDLPAKCIWHLSTSLICCENGARCRLNARHELESLNGRVVSGSIPASPNIYLRLQDSGIELIN